MIKETFPYSHYVKQERVKSLIDPDFTHTKEVGFYCPQCKHVNRPLDHSEMTTCPECGLHMQLFGNALECTADGEEE